MTAGAIADAFGLIREEHEMVVGLLMASIDLVEIAQTDERRIDVDAIRRAAGCKIRGSLVGRELALAELGDPLAELCCVECGTQADLDVDDPLGDWEVVRSDDGLIGVLCVTCCAEREGDDA
jgi:hypothetical protein